MSDAKCMAVEERLADAIDGTLDAELATHVEGCDTCRDQIHDAAFVIEELRALGGDHAPPSDLESRILAAIDARAVKPPLARRMYGRQVGAAMAIAAIAAGSVFVLRGPRPFSGVAAPSAPWTGIVARVVGPDGGLTIEERGATRTLRSGDRVAAGARLRTDVRTRARITLDDGTFLVLDRGAEIALDGTGSRTAKITRGSLVVDATSSTTVPARVTIGGATLSTPGARIALSTLGEGGAIAIARGHASVEDPLGRATLEAGEGASVGGGPIRVRSGGLASAFSWSDLEESSAGGEANVPGLGVLRARLPGATGDGDQALRLAQQKVTVKIAGDVARTEIEQTFQSDDSRVLEGIFRFPLPADAQLERLALDVDGKLEEGSFVDKDKGSAIWKGVLFHSTPRPQPQPQEELIWVPGPWHDPALLEWRAGGRMELKIFPIPARGSRRVVLAYTQQLGKSAGLRRYVYPLPHFGSTATTIDDFALDVQVVGHDPGKPINVRGYEAEANDGSLARRAVHRKSFTPNGDFVMEYRRRDDDALATSWAYQPASGEKGFVALNLAPAIPRISEGGARTHVIVVDASRSMFGERWSRAAALVSRVVAEMDPRDAFAVLACDVTCAPFAIDARTPTAANAQAVRGFLEGTVPEGASDPAAAIRAAAALARTDKRAPRVIYVGDGAATIGARTPAAIETAVRAAGVPLTAVAIGVDADAPSLAAMARGGGGVVIPYVAGQSLAGAALDVLEASYGVALRDPVLELPAGIEAIAPTRLPAIRAGSEVTITARLTGSEVSGNAKLSGTFHGKPWSTTIPITIRASGDPGNAFVPRMWAAQSIADLEAQGGVAERTKIVELSKTFSVPSRFTSLLVLESPAMAAAFGVEPRKRTYEWSGDALPSATTTPTVSEDEARADDAFGFGGGAAPTVPAKAKPLAKPVIPDAAKEEKSVSGPGRWMRRVWHRTASFAGGPALDLESKIVAARTAVISSPDSRDKLEALFGLVARRDSLEEARAVMTTWTSRDPLDVTATLRRSELAAREADRVRALRVLTGALDGRPDDLTLADGIADVAARAGENKLSCALRAVHAEARPNDIDAVARRIACLRDDGDATMATATLDTIAPALRASIEARVLTTTKPAPAWGDLVVDGSWTDGADLDLAIVDPKGVRLSWLSPTGVRASDATSTTREVLAVPWAGAGAWTIEVNRAAPSDQPATGTINIRVLGQTRTYPFALVGSRSTVARVQIGWTSRLEAAGWE
jgi:hypothetical protein